MYGFSGEIQDSTGMVYLRARHYDPGIGLFTSRDTWVGDANLPMSYNRWAYTNGNPVNYTDPSSQTPYSESLIIDETRNDRDLSWRLYKELSDNVKSNYVKRIRELLKGDLTDKQNAINGWIYLVKDRAKWDF